MIKNKQAAVERLLGSLIVALHLDQTKTLSTLGLIQLRVLNHQQCSDPEQCCLKNVNNKSKKYHNKNSLPNYTEDSQRHSHIITNKRIDLIGSKKVEEVGIIRIILANRQIRKFSPRQTKRVVEGTTWTTQVHWYLKSPKH